MKILATLFNQCLSTFCSLQRDPKKTKRSKIDGGVFKLFHKDLKLSLPCLHDRELNNLLRRKKLYLVLDLDHTLVHSVTLDELTNEERELFAQLDSFPSSLHRTDDNMMAKLRPFVHTFLKEASELFDMYICTLGCRSYAVDMMKLLDPDNVYFDNYSKVIAREDCPGKDRKSLDVFLRNKDAAVVILDDTREVWENKCNVIVPERYHYFNESLKRSNKDATLKSYSVLKTDECESTGTLAITLKVLRDIHAEFFDMADQNTDLEQQDVRELLTRFRTRFRTLE